MALGCKKDEYDLVCQICNHVFDVRNEINEEIDLYIDQYYNIIASQKNIDYVKNYDATYNLLKNIYYPVFIRRIENLKELMMKERAK